MSDLHGAGAESDVCKGMAALRAALNATKPPDADVKSLPDRLDPGRFSTNERASEAVQFDGLLRTESGAR